MNFELEPKDIEAIAGRVIEKLLPALRDLQKPDRLMAILEISALLGKSKGHICQWVNLAIHGLSYFPFQKAGRSLRFSEEAIREWMKKKTLRR